MSRHFLYSIRQLRQIEQTAMSLSAANSLMPVAGLAAARVARGLVSEKNSPILVVAGPGNNGGDAFEVAAHLAADGHNVTIWHCPPVSTSSIERDTAFKKVCDDTRITWLARDQLPVHHYALVIDGLFGIGLSKPIPVELVPLVQWINSLPCPILALDVPSGLDTEHGVIVGELAVRATHTITFIGDKVGLHTCHGRDYAGLVECADLGIDHALFPESQMELNQRSLFPLVFKPRRHNTNKGSNGSVQLLGGATGMQGALLLAARAALYSGAGKVLAGFVDAGVTLDSQQPEIMVRNAAQLLTEGPTARVIGTGLGNSTASFDLLTKALLAATPLVIDADALTMLAQQPALTALCNGRTDGTTLLTPHPLEAARLLACDVAQIQADRVGAAKKLARRFSSIVILKGSGSVIACPAGRVVINTTGNPGLASVGTGDVLAGTCGALIGQHQDVWQAALAAAWLHGAAADDLVQQGIGPIGLVASELIVAIRRRLNGVPI